MTRAAARASLALGLLAGAAVAAVAQDTSAVPAVPAVPARHMLSVDTSRVRPFRRAYDMIVHTKDSAIVIGQRELALSPATYAGSPVWMLVETRTGIAPAAETLYIAPELRPLHWNASLRGARLGATFVGDTIFGATSAPAGRHSLILAGRPDLLVSQPMIELVLPLLPLATEWTDSAAVLAVDLAAGTVIPVEISVIGEESVQIDSSGAHQAWMVAVRADARTILLWIDRETGDVQRVQQPLPPHVGTMLEYRRRAEVIQAPPPT
ncbi:MAG: hypothetical protein ACRENU_13880 [Gemmatimonadaceae bacterium]